MVVRKMAVVNSKGFVCRELPKKPIARNWWLVGQSENALTGVVYVKQIRLPPEFVGRRVRFKVELVDEEKAEDGGVV